MKNLFDPPRVAEIKERLAQLKPDDKPLWGVMNPAQAVRHCSAGLEWAVGDTVPPRMLLGRLIGGIIKPKVLANDEPIRRNSPTASSLVVNDSRDLQVERVRLCGLIDRFSSRMSGTTHPHTFFGRLTPEEWAI